MTAPVSRYARNSRKINPVILLQVTLAIRLAGSGVVPPDTLAGARRLAAAIFDHAGVRLDWTAGSAPLSLQILDRRPAGSRAAGRAVVDAGYASVSWPQVVAAAADCDQPAVVVLGAAIAHEIGHLLLGKAHSSGIMSPRLGCPELRRAGRGELRFLPDEARRIRYNLNRK